MTALHTDLAHLERKATISSVPEGLVAASAALPVPVQLDGLIPDAIEREKRLREEAGVLDEEERIGDEGESEKGWRKRGNSRGHGKGLTDGDDEVEDIPENNMWLVMPSLGLVAFVAAMDQTIVATALPTIAAEFGATPSQYAWVGTAYLLTQTLMTPINGRVTDIIGRKPMLYAAVALLLVFDLMCGAAQNITWLIVSRAFAGIGGGSTVSLTLIVISDIVPLHKRGMFQGYMSASWGMSSVLGPIIGGILTEKASWRWCFYMNGPICGIALLCLIFTLKLNPAKGHSWNELRATFDFPGLALVMVASALLIVGFSGAADKGFTPKDYGIIGAGVAVLILLLVHVLYTKRNAIIPTRMLKTRTTVFFLIASFFNSFMFMPAVYLLPQFFQGVMGNNAFQSGIQLIPLLVCVSGASMIAGQITTRLRIVRPVCWVGFCLASVGYGLFYGLYGPKMNYATQESVQVITGLGVGLCLAATMLVIQAAMPMRDMASATAGWVLLRSMGATIGVAITQSVFNAGLHSNLQKVPGYGTEFQSPTGTRGYSALQDLPEGPTKTAVLQAFSDSFKPVWLMGCIMLALSFVITLFTKSYSLNRRRAAPSQVSTDATAVEDDVPSPTDEKKLGDLESGASHLEYALDSPTTVRVEPSKKE